MSKKISLTLLCMLLLATSLLFTSCGDKTPSETPASSYTIRFSVSGTETSVTVDAGATPAFTGDTEWSDSEHFYRILGWDKEFAPASADTLYTAEVGVYSLETVDVLWDLQSGLIRTQAHIGEVPTPPEMATTVQDNKAVYTFTGEWTPALTAITKDKEVFKAVYTSVPRQYDITFVSEDKTVAVSKVNYGEVPTAPTIAIPTGFKYVAWGTLASVTGDATYTASFCNVDPDIYATVQKTLASGSTSDRASAALFIGLEEKNDPGHYEDLVLSYLRWVITGGHEPSFDFTPNFYQPMASAAIAVAKTIPGVWNQLTESEVARLDLLMKCMAVQSALATDDSCSYTSGPAGNGNYNKSWNPNYPLSNVTQIIFCVSYFGSAEAVNQILADFDYDTYIAAFNEYNWTNVLSIWTRPVNEDGTISYQTASEGTLKETWKATILTDDGNGHLTLEITTSSEDVEAQEYGNLGLGFVDGTTRTINYTTPEAMMMNGGPVYAMKALFRISQYVGKPCGTGIGVPAIGAKGYSYKGHTLNDIAGIWNSLLDYNYSAGLVTSKEVPNGNGYRCYIYDGTSSPVEGLDGMMKEFHSGERSSVGYCRVDFIMCASSTAAMDALGVYDSDAESNLARSKKVWVGNVDFLYKAEHGYVSYSGTAVRGDPKPEYGSGVAYTLWAFQWNENGAKRFTFDDFVFPDPNKDVVESVTQQFAKPVGESESKDITLTLGSKAESVKGSSNFWEGDFILSFSLNYTPECIPSFEIRLRGSISNDRGGIFSFSRETGSLTPSTALPADANSPVSIPLGGYGWHRITIRVHQGATANETTKSVDYSIVLTVYIDGEEIGSYNDVAGDYLARGWLLYGATYDETAPNHLAYTTGTPQPTRGTGAAGWTKGSNNNPYFQIYRGGVLNDPANVWLLQIGDIKTYFGTAAEANVGKITYTLNGGSFEDSVAVSTTGGYKETFFVNGVAFYATSKALTPVAPVKEGYEFAGWYDNAELTGSIVTALNTENGANLTLFAAWKLPGTDPVE